MALDDAEDHGQTQAGALIALGREERLEATFSHVRRHSRSAVDYFHECIAVPLLSSECDNPGRRDRIHGVENQIRQHFAQFGADAVGCCFDVQIGLE